MPARGTATGRQVASNRGIASGRLPASGRQNVDSSGGGVVDDMTFLEEEVAGVGGAASFQFAAIPGSYRHLMIFIVANTSDGSVRLVEMTFNGDTGANYDREQLQATDVVAQATGAVGQTSMTCCALPGSGGPAGAMGTAYIIIPYYSTTTQDKAFVSNTWLSIGTASANQLFTINYTGAWRTANAAITQIDLTPTAGNFVENSKVSLYGIT